MDWWQTVGLMATLVATATAVATLGWRILLRVQREIAATRQELGAEIHGLRQEIAEFRDELRADMTRVRSDLGADIASGRNGLVSVGEGLAELRGEVRGVQKAMLALQEDFRIHVYGRRARA